MDAAIEPAAAGDPESSKWFIEHGQSYLKLLREHIRKEDLCLFPAAMGSAPLRQEMKRALANWPATTFTSRLYLRPAHQRTIRRE